MSARVLVTPETVVGSLEVALARWIVFGLFLVSVMNFAAFDLRATSPPAGQSQSKDPCDDTSGGHDCFACCAHLVPITHLEIEARFERIGTVEIPEQSVWLAETTSLFHPPKA